MEIFNDDYRLIKFFLAKFQCKFLIKHICEIIIKSIYSVCKNNGNDMDMKCLVELTIIPKRSREFISNITIYESKDDNKILGTNKKKYFSGIAGYRETKFILGLIF